MKKSQANGGCDHAKNELKQAYVCPRLVILDIQFIEGHQNHYSFEHGPFTGPS